MYIVIEIVNDNGCGLVLLISVSQSSGMEHRTTHSPRKDQSILTQSSGMVISADDLLDGEILESRNKLGSIYLSVKRELHILRRLRDRDHTRTFRFYPK